VTQDDSNTKQARLRAQGYVTAHEAADLMGVHVVTVHKLIEGKKLEALQVPAQRFGAWFVRRASIVAHLGPEAARALGIDPGDGAPPAPAAT